MHNNALHHVKDKTIVTQRFAVKVKEDSIAAIANFKAWYVLKCPSIMVMSNQNTNNKIAVIADDLTGANDTGVQFAKQGLKTIVLMGGNPPARMIEENVVVIDSQSRSLASDEAYRNVAIAAAWFRDSQFQVVFKKIDSTLRGNIGTEIDAIMDTCGQGVAIVAPAFPKNGRISAGGYHFLQGVPLEATELANDPISPITESHIPTLLSGQTSRSVGHVGIKSIIAGPEGILNAMRKIWARGEEVILCDAWQDEHLKMIAAAGIRLEKHVLWVGSAGLAEYLPPALGLHVGPVNKTRAEKHPQSDAPVVVLAGSMSHITRAQVRILKQRPDFEHIELDPRDLLQPETAAKAIRGRANDTLKAIKAGKDVVITSGYSDGIVEKTMGKAALLNLSKQQAAQEIAAGMGRFCREIASGVALGGLVLTGGDIALNCCSHLSAAGIYVLKEVAPGIPLGRLKGGLCNGLRVVTKAGAFGAEDALCKAVDCLKQYGQL